MIGGGGGGGGGHLAKFDAQLYCLCTKLSHWEHPLLQCLEFDALMSETRPNGPLASREGVKQPGVR
jgi:hypothetical protein